MPGIKVLFEEQTLFKGSSFQASFKVHLSYEHPAHVDDALQWGVDQVDIMSEDGKSWEPMAMQHPMYWIMRAILRSDLCVPEIERAIDAAMADDYDENQYEGEAA